MGASGIVWYISFQLASKSRKSKLIGHSSARDLATKDTVAVKKLNDPFRTNFITKLFLREIQLLQQLRHENVCMLARRKYNVLIDLGD